METSASELPEDSVREILLKLPAKSLIRFRTVCKSWLSIISDSQFIRSHCHIAAQEKPKLVCPTSPENPKNYEYIRISECFSYGYIVFGSCNGIVCVSSFRFDNICLWNPSIQQYKWLPPATECILGSVGFGYDSVLDDYKVLLIPYDTSDGDVKVVELVQVYSTNACSWREIPVSIPMPCSPYMLFINGVLYFEVRGEKNKLLSFDLHHEVFKVIFLPTCMLEKRSNLLDFEGSLAILTIDSTNDVSVNQETSASEDGKISLWMLEDGCEVSRLNWIRKFTLEADLWVEMYLGAGEFYGRRGYTFGEGNETISHIWYDNKKKRCNYFHLQFRGFGRTLKYTESLVSFQGFESTEWLSREQSSRLQKQMVREWRRQKLKQYGSRSRGGSNSCSSESASRSSTDHSRGSGNHKDVNSDNT